MTQLPSSDGESFLSGTLPNELARKVKRAVLSQFPEWARYVEMQEGGDIEMAVPAPKGSNAGNLIILTAKGIDIWIRYGPAYMSYAVDDEFELVDIAKQLVTEEASFVVILDNEKWVETTLVQSGQTPMLKPGQTARIVSWLGTYDEEVA
jgi:hypothetical protein